VKPHTKIVNEFEIFAGARVTQKVVQDVIHRNLPEKPFFPKNHATLLYFSKAFDNDFFDRGPWIGYPWSKPVQKQPLIGGFRVHH
jgi:hypothetical protein